MNTDPSTCCSGKSSKSRRSNSSHVKRKRSEKNDDDSDDSNSTQTSKHKKKNKKRILSTDSIDMIEPIQQPLSASDEIPLGDIVCTPDIMSMFSAPLPEEESSISTATPSVKVVKKRKIVLKPLNFTRPPPGPVSSTTNIDLPSNLVETDRQVVTLPTPKAAPVFHTINGYTIDLNNAAKQDTFRLPNGKLIQVKKQPNMSVTSKPSAASSSKTTPYNPKQFATIPSARFTRPPTVQPVVSQKEPPPLTSFNLKPTNAPNMTLNHMSQIRHIGYNPTAPTPAVLTPQQIQMQSLHLQQQQQLLNTLQMVPNTTVIQQHQPTTTNRQQQPVASYLQPSPAAMQHLQQLQALASSQNQQPTSQQQQTSSLIQRVSLI